jgi:putative ABC transport system ATP-binding protein
VAVDVAELPVAVTPAIEAVDLYRFFHTGEAETRALRGVSLRVEAGEMVALTGPSGSGKSTLLNCLAGLDEPDGGHVLLQGKRLTRRPEAERARQRAAGIGILLQSDNLFEGLSVAENVQLQMVLAGKFDRDRLKALLSRIGLLDRHAAVPGSLSGGEVARAGLAVALAAAPLVLLADEPTGEVDSETEDRLITLLAAECGRGMAALIATHSPAVAARAERAIRITDGRVIEATDGATASVAAHA